MQQELSEGKPRAVGFNQTMKAIQNGRARVVFLALDAAEELAAQIRFAAQAQGIPLVEYATMRGLGRACRIQVSCAAAALLHS